MKEQTVTLQLPEDVFESIERARGEMDVSAYIAKLLQQQLEQTTDEAAAREEWLSKGRKQYTPEVCRQTIELNEEFPIHEE